MSIETLDALSDNLDVVDRWHFQPSLVHFRLAVAQPRYELFVDEGERVLGRAAGRVHGLLTSADGCDNESTALHEIIDHFDNALRIPDAVVRAGDEWYRRLERAAIGVATQSWPRQHHLDWSVVRQEAELDLLDSSPWSYQDRLLTALEAAHRELIDRRRTILLDLRTTAHRRRRTATTRAD